MATTQTLELHINGAITSVTLRGSRCELRILTGSQGRDKNLLFKQMGAAMSRLAHREELLEGEIAQMASGSTTTARLFCRSAGKGLFSGEVTIFRVHGADAHGAGNHEVVQAL